MSLFVAQLVSAQPTPAPSQTSASNSSAPYLYPGEVTQYQNQALTPISSFIGEFLQTSIDGAQTVNQTSYRLTVSGLVNQTLEYTYDDAVNNFTARLQVVQILCVEGWSATVLWQGVSVSDLLNAAGVSPQANTLIFYGSDGYSSALPLSYVVQNNLMLAYKMNNVTLTADTGFPFILVAQNQYGYKWVKWVTEIDVSNNTGYLGYWESRGYSNNATIGNPSVAPLSQVAIGEILGATAVIIAASLATYVILIKVKKRRSNSQTKLQQAV